MLMLQSSYVTQLLTLIIRIFNIRIAIDLVAIFFGTNEVLFVILYFASWESDRLRINSAHLVLILPGLRRIQFYKFFLTITKH